MIPKIVRRRPLEQTFSIYTALLVSVLIGATMLLVHARVEASLRRGLEAQAYSIAQSIGAVATPSLLAYNGVALQVAAERAAENPDIHYVVLHDKELRVAGVSGTSFADGVEEALEPIREPTVRNVMQTLEDGEQHPVLEAIVPVRVEGSSAPWGHVRVGACYDPILAELNRARLGLVLLGLVLAAISIGLSRFVARRITAPLRSLAAGTEALAWGDTSRRVPVSGSTELAELAQAFNRMLDRVEEQAQESAAYQDALARLNATLEEQVLERTRALEESEKQYRTLVDDSPDAILIVQAGRVRFVNRSFVEIFGVVEEEALAEDFDLAGAFEADSAETVRERIAAWESGAASPPVEVIGRDARGRRYELELRGSRIEYRGRAAAECVMVDRTEAKQLRERLEDTERLRSLGELAGGVAHDFNNLLGAILGRAQLLRGRDLGEEVDRELSIVEKAARDGRETVRRIQEFSRLQTESPFCALDLRELIQDAVEITRTRWKTEAERRNVSIRVALHLEDTPSILGNASELREVFTNLIINATDAMPQGGTLTLRCFAGDDPDKVVAEVEDTGVGMTEEIRRHLFDPFFTTKGVAGTGLGMSVAYGIVSRHHGVIDVESRMGRGTRFRLEFPAETAGVLEGLRREVGEPEDAPAAVEVPAAAGRRTSRILVIDDEAPIAQLLEDALSADGHAVEIACSGKDGVRKAGLADYDLVLTDLGMPDMSGWEVADRIRASHPGLPVILVTGWGATISEQEIASSGVAAVIHKPFEIRELLKTASGVLSRSVRASL